ncbi:hypothetical protein ACFLTA_09330 [Bacteroidota bacterium]
MQYRSLLLVLVIIFLSPPARSQEITDFFGDVVLRIDTSEYSMLGNQVSYLDQQHLAFRFSEADPVCEVTLHALPGDTLEGISLLPSGDFELIDSLLILNHNTARFKVRFRDLANSGYLKFSFQSADSIWLEAGPTELKLLPYTPTYLKLYVVDEKLYIGEEKVFELLTNNIENIRFENDWVETENYNYRISKTFNQIRLHVVPRSLGTQQLSIPVKVKKPILNNHGELVFDLPLIEQTFSVSQSRLQFLNVDRKEVTLDDSTRSEGIEIQIENNRMLQIQKTYRIESQEEPGGSLIAELFTKTSLTNNRVLCILRVYNYHRTSDGYLFIKDGDIPRFITNFDITPKTTVDKISILREGLWTQNMTVYPGEIISVKIEGEGLHKADFTFEQMEDVTSFDSLIRGENIALYRFNVPMDVSLRRLELFNHARPTGRALSVKEYQSPRTFDFLWIDYQGVRQSIEDLPSTILVDGTIQNLVFGSDPDMIDSEEKLYGKQYLRLDITITGRRDELIEVKTIDNIVICPGIKSPRSEFYNRSDCGLNQFDLNKYFRKKTSSLEIWSQIKIRVSHQRDKYSSGGNTQEFDIILRKPTSFDVEVSFPAGLITVSKPSPGKDDRLGQLTGISIAMIAQFTFYHPDKINVQRPFKIGAGFLALNTFNFSNDADRDIGLVVLGSLYPTTKDAKLTFPLYFGGGYQLSNQKWFLLVGPGIRIRF